MTKAKQALSPTQNDALISILESRFEENMDRHPGLTWSQVKKRIENNSDALFSLMQMEESGGEPDVVKLDPKSKSVTFVDCSVESPKGRRSFCYDREALDARKEHKPKNNVVDVAKSMGVKILDEENYRTLQSFGEFDLKTSSWIETPKEIRKLGGALFCDRRYDTIFVYHNGADSYYAARGFRALLNI